MRMPMPLPDSSGSGTWMVDAFGRRQFSCSKLAQLEASEMNTNTMRKKARSLWEYLERQVELQSAIVRTAMRPEVGAALNH